MWQLKFTNFYLNQKINQNMGDAHTHTHTLIAYKLQEVFVKFKEQRIKVQVKVTLLLALFNVIVGET